MNEQSSWTTFSARRRKTRLLSPEGFKGLEALLKQSLTRHYRAKLEEIAQRYQSRKYWIDSKPTLKDQRELLEQLREGAAKFQEKLMGIHPVLLPRLDAFNILDRLLADVQRLEALTGAALRDDAFYDRATGKRRKIPTRTAGNHALLICLQELSGVYSRVTKRAFMYPHHPPEGDSRGITGPSFRFAEAFIGLIDRQVDHGTLVMVFRKVIQAER